MNKRHDDLMTVSELQDLRDFLRAMGFSQIQVVQWIGSVVDKRREEVAILIREGITQRYS